MSNAPTAQVICDATGISKSYAAKIIGGHRSPPASLAIAIYRKVGWKHPSIQQMSKADMAAFERHSPWVAPTERSAAA